MPPKDDNSSGNLLTGNFASLFQKDTLGQLPGVLYLLGLVQNEALQKWLRDRPKVLYFLGILFTIYWQWKQAKSISDTVINTARTWLSADYECDGNDEGFNALYKHIEENIRPRNISTSYTIRSVFENKNEAVRTSTAADQEQEVTCKVDTDGNDKAHKFVCDQQPNWEYAFLKWWQVIFLKREKNDIHGNGKISMIGLRCTAVVKDILDKASKQQSISRNEETTMYRADGYQWSSGRPKPQRNMDTVEIDAKEKSRLLHSIDFFVAPKQEKFYIKQGAPYRTGYLFYGPPGTGKTSCARAIAGRTKRNLYKITLSDASMDDESLLQLLYDIPEPSVVLFEDIDSAGIGRENRVVGAGRCAASQGHNAQVDSESDDEAEDDEVEVEEQKSRVTYSGLLNAIDGTDSPEGHIFIMTTNCREELDDALLRDGRCNIQLYFGYSTKATAKDMYIRIMGDSVATFHSVEQSNNGERILPADQVGAAEFSGHTDKAEPSMDGGSHKPPIITDCVKEFPSTAANLANSSIPRDRTSNNTNAHTRLLYDLANEFASKIPEETFVPAELQTYLFTYIYEPKRAVDDLEQWKERKHAERRKRDDERARAAAKQKAKVEEARKKRREERRKARAKAQVELQLAQARLLAAKGQIGQKQQ